LKKFKRLFQDAERLEPSPGTWRLIAAQVDLESGAAGAQARPWPALRVAASVLLAVGVMGLGLSLRHKPGMVAASASQAGAADRTAEIFDADLLNWHADLGEFDAEADEAEEVL
jgi:hypothetical protein